MARDESLEKWKQMKIGYEEEIQRARQALIDAGIDAHPPDPTAKSDEGMRDVVAALRAEGYGDLATELEGASARFQATVLAYHAALDRHDASAIALGEQHDQAFGALDRLMADVCAVMDWPMS